jgi:hypothetical protein
MAATSTVTTTEPLGVTLERERLEHRARRVELASLALRRIADVRDPVPPPLLRAINRFDAQLVEIRERLIELRPRTGASD